MKMYQRFIIIISLVLAILMFVSACASGKETASGGSGSSDTAVVTSDSGLSGGSDTVGTDNENTLSDEAASGNNGNAGVSSNAGGNNTTTDNSGSTNSNSSKGPNTSLTYAEYIAMTSVQQEAFCNSFASLAEFTKWHAKAKAEYDATRSNIEVGSNGGAALGGKN